MNNLIISTECAHCGELFKVLKQNPTIDKTIKYWYLPSQTRMDDEDTLSPQDIPPQVTNVPAVITNTKEILMGNEVFKWVEHLRRSLNVPTSNQAKKANAVNNSSASTSLDSINLSNGKNNLTSFAIIENFNDTSQIGYSRIGEKSGSEGIDPDDFNNTSKKVYNRSGENTRSNNKLPSVQEMIQKRQQQLNSV